MNRRELFSQIGSNFKSTKEFKPTIRPPYFKTENDFEKCLLCIDKPCVISCEEDIILIQDEKPTISFKQGGCTYCDECAKACLKDILRVEHKRNIDIAVKIDMIKCISWQNIMCFSCKDPCSYDAVIFDGLFKPIINESLCTSCGFCIKACPTFAIELSIQNI
ncbi:MAG: ferredoxin-type protein NapF [Epsilonproteobacteria bacterium]|nr:MAG: ferredoxin-type protein NapF [Campylobacterota bacterium]